VDAHARADAAEQRAHLFKGESWCLAQGVEHDVHVLWRQGRFSPAPVVERFRVPEFFSLLQQFFDQPEGDAEKSGHFLAGVLSGVVAGEDAMARVEGNCFHQAGKSSSFAGEWQAKNGYIIY
jgi:hypothetical protein